MKTINDISAEDRLVVLKWAYTAMIFQSEEDPVFMLHNTIRRMEKELSVKPENKSES